MRIQFEPHFSQLDEESLSRVFSCIHTVHSVDSLSMGYLGLEDPVFSVPVGDVCGGDFPAGHAEPC